METALAFTTRLYRKEQYACRLRLKEQRFGALRREAAIAEQARIADVMTRWLRRCVRDQSVVIGRARIEVIDDLTDFMARYRWLYATAPAFRDVHPEDRNVLAGVVDDTRHRSIEVPVLITPDYMVPKHSRSAMMAAYR